jgi:hypothetical protein
MFSHSKGILTFDALLLFSVVQRELLHHRHCVL